jgi:hypothetical protein
MRAATSHNTANNDTRSSRQKTAGIEKNAQQADGSSGGGFSPRERRMS